MLWIALAFGGSLAPVSVAQTAPLSVAPQAGESALEGKTETLKIKDIAAKAPQ